MVERRQHGSARGPDDALEGEDEGFDASQWIRPGEAVCRDGGTSTTWKRPRP